MNYLRQVGLLTLATIGLLCMIGRAQEAALMDFKIIETRITLHEPVILNFLVRNGLRERIDLDLGFNRKGSFEFAVTAPGETTPLMTRITEEGIGRIGRLSVGPGETFEETLLLNEWYSFSQPGVYEVDAYFRGPIQTQSGTKIAEPASVRLHLQILPRDAKRLETICEKLASAALESPTLTAASQAAIELSFIQDPVAIPYLERVLRTGRGVRNQAAVGLGRIATPDSVEILLSALKDQDAEASFVVRSTLADVRVRSKDATIKKKIDAALRTQP